MSRRPPWLVPTNPLPPCTAVDPDLFFPQAKTSEALLDWVERRLCRACPYRVECLDWAIEHGEAGIWAGTSESMRTAMRRTRPRKTCPRCRSRSVFPFTSGGYACLDCGVSWT